MAKQPRLNSFNSATNPEMQKLRAQEDRVAFTGVTFRNFSLPANVNRLQTFCDNYLNFSDDPEGISNGHYFKAASSNVTMSILNYGKMSTESENLGWIAQHEVLFSVPVEWYKVNSAGELAFYDWAYVAPFIFVDNDRSLGVGREVYGWTKVRGWIESSKSAWTSDPRNPRRLLSMATELFPTLYTEDAEDARTLIDVIQEPPMSFLRSPFDTNDRLNPWWSASRNARQYLSAINDALQFASGLPIFGNEGTRRLGTGLQMYSRLARSLLRSMPWIRPGLDTEEAARQRSHSNPSSLQLNNLTLKQFRDAQEPEMACYQALVNSTISIERLYDGGFLGGSNLLAGDITGGYRIHVHEYEEQPIIETLGIEVTETQRDEHGTPVAVLSPVLPTWLACDLRYDLGTTLCWRTKRSDWSTKTTSAPEERSDKRENRFNTTRGAALRASVGPFHYPDTIMRFFPLSADKVRLRNFCREIFDDINVSDATALNFANLVDEYDGDTRSSAAKDQESTQSRNPGGGAGNPSGAASAMRAELNRNVQALLDSAGGEKARQSDGRQTQMQSMPDQIGLNHFQPYGSRIYMMLRSYGSEHGRMYSEHNNLGLTARREVAFIVPIKWSSWDERAKRVTQRLVFLTPYYFCDSMRHTLSESEVNGRPAVHCELDGDDDWWFRASESDAHTKKIRATLRTLLMPALDVGQPAEFLKLVEIVAGDIEAALPSPDRDEELTKSGVETDTAADAAANESIATVLCEMASCIDLLTLKQYRATGNIEDHCYQSIVLVRSRIEEVWDAPRPIRDPTYVCITSFPTMPIVQQLGIHVHHVDSREQSVVQRLKPIDPWSVRVATRDEVGVNLYTRVYDGVWERATEEIEPESRPGIK